MSEDHSADEPSTDELSNERGSPTTNDSARHETTVGRRSYLRLAGATAASASLISSLGTAAAEAYDTLTIPAGVHATPSDYSELLVTSGEIRENLLVDVTADGASAIMVARGSDWVIRDIGFKGVCDGDPDYSSAKCIRADVDSGSNGTISTCYFGDGGTSNGYVGIFVKDSHAGDLKIRQCDVSNFANNGIYASAPGQSDGGGGEVNIDSCYAKNNNVAQYRLGTDTSDLKDSIAHVDSDVGSLDGVENARGLWVRNEANVEVTNSDVLLEHPDASYCFWEDDDSGGVIRIHDSELDYRDGADGYFKPGGDYDTNNNGQTPDVTKQSYIPVSAEDAADD